VESDIELGKKRTKFSLAELAGKRANVVSGALEALSKELAWKVYLEYALTLEKKGLLDECRKYLREAVITSPENLRWKAWIIGSRVELKSGRTESATLLLEKSLSEVPSKQRSLVLAEEAKLHEYMKDFPKAEKAVAQACVEARQDWKIYLEAITMYMRYLDFNRAMETAKQALQLYSCTGRLWAVLIQLQHTSKELIEQDAPMTSFIQALQEVPKSGEVWCEGARLRLNPFSQYFDLAKAEEYLLYAVQFTPQYGDSFIELMRLYYITCKLHKLKELKQACINADPNYGMLWFFCKKTALDGPRNVWKVAKRLVLEDLSTFGVFYFHTVQRDDLIGKMWAGLSHVWRVFEGRDLLSDSARWKLIYGNELLAV
jgi:la-related protein 1